MVNKSQHRREGSGLLPSRYSLHKYGLNFAINKTMQNIEQSGEKATADSEILSPLAVGLASSDRFKGCARDLKK